MNHFELLNNWAILIDKKILSLNKAARIHKFFGTSLLILISICFSVIGFLSTYGIVESKNRIIINSIILGFTIISAILETLNNTINPLKTSKDCYVVAKQYRELYKEIQIELLDVKDFCEEACKEKLLYFSNKEQLILIKEPLLIYKYRGTILKN